MRHALSAFQPPTPHPATRRRSFAGLQNGGATCYMSSVFQQLFMQPTVRRGGSLLLCSGCTSRRLPPLPLACTSQPPMQGHCAPARSQI
jgi:uncharacterized UBP type Zn finger protein